MTEFSLDKPTLRKNYVTFAEEVAQSIGTVAPTGGVAALIPLVFATAGNGTWVLFLVMLIAYLLVAFNINQFASRIVSAGGLYTYAEAGLGRFWGLVGGWCYLIGMVLAVGAIAMAFAHYCMPFVHLISPTGLDKIAPVVLTLTVIIAVWWIGCRDIKLSTETILRTEVIAVSLMIVLAIIFLLRSGHGFDRVQFDFTDVTRDGLRLGLVLALFSTTGFESAVTLSSESTSPLKSVPRSLFFGLVPAAFLYIFMSYVLVDCFRGNPVTLDKSDAPFTVLADASGFGFFGWIMSGCILISAFGCVAGCLNAGARVIYSMAQQGEFLAKAGAAHPRYATPAIANHLVAIISVIFCAALFVIGTDAYDGYNYLGQISAFGFIGAYLLVCIAAPVFLRKRDELKPVHVGAAIFSILVLLFGIAGSLYPVPPEPFNYLPYAFMGFLVLGLIYSKIVARKKLEN